MSDNEIINKLKEHFGIYKTFDDSISGGEKFFLLPDGSYLRLDDSEVHDCVIDFLYDSGLIAKSANNDFFQPAYNLGFIRYNGGMSFMSLPERKITSAQYDKLYDMIDYIQNNDDHIEIEVGDQYQEYYFDDYTTDDIIDKIKRYYSSGRLYERRINSMKKYILNEDLFDDIIPAAEIADIEVDEEIPEAPHIDEMGLSSLIINTINNTWNIINDYNILIANVQDKEEMKNIITELVAEENEHIGKLQSLLNEISPNVEKIDDGKVEAEAHLTDTDINEAYEGDLYDRYVKTPSKYIIEIESMDELPSDYEEVDSIDFSQGTGNVIKYVYYSRKTNKFYEYVSY